MRMCPVIYINVALKGTSDAHFPQVDMIFLIVFMKCQQNTLDKGAMCNIQDDLKAI